MMEAQATAQPVCGIEVTAHCPAMMPQYRTNRIDLEIDGTHHSLEWDRTAFYAAIPGVHRVKAALHGLIAKSGARTLEVTIERGEIAELTYSLTMLSIVNPGKLELKRKRASS